MPHRFAPRARAAAGRDKVPLGCNDIRCSVVLPLNVIANRCAHRCGNPFSWQSVLRLQWLHGDADCHDLLCCPVAVPGIGCALLAACRPLPLLFARLLCPRQRSQTSPVAVPGIGCALLAACRPLPLLFARLLCPRQRSQTSPAMTGEVRYCPKRRIATPVTSVTDSQAPHLQVGSAEAISFGRRQ